MVGDLDILDGRQIDNRELVAVRFHSARFHVILHVFWNAGEQELIISCMRL